MFTRIAAWAAGPAQLAQGQFTHGPADQLRDLRDLPDGHLVIGMDSNAQPVTWGVAKGGSITWDGPLQSVTDGLRRDVADAVSENADLGQVEAFSGWEISGDEWTRPVFVAGEDPDADTGKSVLRLVFAPCSPAIVEATFNGEDIPSTIPEQPDADTAPMPG